MCVHGGNDAESHASSMHSGTNIKLPHISESP